jgi:GAF domain-containing protein
MQAYPKAENDAERVAFLESLALIDSAPDRNLDRINALTQQVLNVAICAVTLLDNERQWFKCVIGLETDETSRDVAICNYTVMQDEVFEITDLAADERTRSNPLVLGEPYLRYYAGAPLIVNGFRIGSLCILDYQPRPPLTERERRILRELADLVVREITVQSIIKESLALISSRGETQLPD